VNTKYKNMIADYPERLFVRQEEMNLMAAIISKVEPYYNLNDGAHKVSHAVDVMLLAMTLQKATMKGVIGYYEDRRNIIASALLHDIFVHRGRASHETAAVFELNFGTLKDWFTQIIEEFKLDRNIVVDAINEHRASYSGAYTSIISEYVSGADRGRPDIDRLCKRVKSGTDATQDEHMIDHIIEKFGREGYARWSDSYKLHFGSELRQMQDTIGDRSRLTEIYGNQM